MARTTVLAALTVAALMMGTTMALADKATGIANIGEGTTPAITSDSKDRLYVVFEAKDTTSNVQQIFCSSSADTGKTWSEPKNISRTPGSCSHPDVCVEHSGAIDVVWADSTPGVKYQDVYMTRSDDGGKSWGESVPVAKTPGFSSEPALATGPDDSIHVVWTDSSSGKGHPDIFYTLSVDHGKTWVTAIDISNTTNASSEPAIAVGPDGIVHAAWQDRRMGATCPSILYMRRISGIWGKAADLTTECCKVPGRPYVSEHPALACDGAGNTYLAWVDNRKKEHAQDIWCRVADKQGKLGKAINMSDSPGLSSQPAMADDPSWGVATVWSDTTSGVENPHIFGRIGIKGGFSKVMDLTEASHASKHPHVAFLEKKVAVVWQEAAGDKSLIRLISTSLNVPTGPVEEVDPSCPPDQK